MRYVCTQCSGRSGEEHSFELDTEPNHCPWCGTNRDHYLVTLEAYLRQRIEDLEETLEIREEKLSERWDKIKELEAELEDD